MARPHDSPVLAQLRSAKSFSEQAAALKVLKNEVVGHMQLKEAWVVLGVLEPIVLTLGAPRSPSRLNGKDARAQLAVPRPLCDEDSVRLQALQLIASFANGGPAFLAPLHAARVVPAMLENNLSPLANPPQLVVAALKALTDIAVAASLAPASSPIDMQTLADGVFALQHIESLNVMLSTSSPKHLLQQQMMLAAGLISRLCREERHQHALTAAGVLDSLATQLARFAVRDGLVVPGAEELAYSDGLYEVFPEPAAPGADVGPVLEAIAAILGDSKYRANRLVNSPAILAIFPSIRFELDKVPQGHQPSMTAMDHILPAMPMAPSRGQSASQSSLPTPDRSESRGPSLTSASKLGFAVAWDSPRLHASGGNADDAAAEDIESPLVPWLIHLVRTLGESDRLMAAAVLAALFRAGLGRKSVRETSIGLLVMPILVDMVAKNDKDGPDSEGPTDAAQRLILERAPAVLARLMTDSEYLQKAAFECDCLGVVAKLLKRAYQPVPEVDQAKYWSPHPDTGMEAESTSAAARLGEDGVNPLLVHRIRLREASLKAIGALCAGKEDYRKAFLAEDLVPYVVESLCEFPRKPRQAKDRPRDKPNGEPARKGPSRAYGTNPVSVLAAGCHVVRMLARSVSILRTALVDYAVALPVFHFMTHADVDVQIAATSTVINLVVEVSPVRELLTEKGVMRVLCGHAHSDNPALRQNALWALKHFVDAVGPELKKASLEQLDPEWLLQLICDDTQDTVLHDARAREAAQVGGGDDDDDDDDDNDADEDMDMHAPDEPLRWLYGSNGSMHELDASRSTRLRQAEDRLAAIREAELNPARRARAEDLAIQEQGLDFIRNLIGRPESAAASETPGETTQMIDYMLAALGEKRFFAMLESKLRHRMLHPFSRRTPAPGREPRVVYPQARIIVAVVYILVHMAASVPRHRQLVVDQTELLKLLAQQAANKDREVRVALCHLVINLTWQEDESEADRCAARAHELKRLGFLGKMELLRHQDRDLDVRERAKTAAWQIEHATY